MKRRLEAAGLVLVALLVQVGCQNEDPQDRGDSSNTNTTIVNVFGPGPVPGATPSPNPGGDIPVAIHLACDIMRDPQGNVLPNCAPQLAPYSAPTGSKGRGDASLVNGQGFKVGGTHLVLWQVLSGSCTVDGTNTVQGVDAWNPGIEIAAGSCILEVQSEGFRARREFIGL